ncbi:uncharacterized protein A4U43_C05F6060 [Asparagus officinalis]|uniref:Uncharacterized protein n=1 Tax=Asparagus officinalis TaxID=4686 RepID=A0A5P1EQB3_ASPOF|nr:uncharacterized protein A4U43_C05F6060 [Asparagus officinalis]
MWWSLSLSKDLVERSKSRQRMGEEPEASHKGSATKPQKCLRLDLVPEDVEEITANVTEITAQLVGPSSTTAKAERSEKKRGDTKEGRQPEPLWKH